MQDDFRVGQGGIDAACCQDTSEVFLVFSGLVFVSLVVMSNGLLLLSQFLMNRYAQRLGGEFSTSVYGHYLDKNMLFHNNANSANLIQHVMRDTQSISTKLVAPALRLNGRVFSIVLLSSLIVYVDVWVAFCSLFCLLFVYWFVFYSLRSRIYRNGKMVSALNANRNRVLNESFEGVVDIKLYRAEHQLLQRYATSTRKVNRATAENLNLGQSPYYLVEAVVLVGVLLIALYFIMYKGGIDTVLPVLTLYCMAGFKLIPKVQQSYHAITKIRSAQPVFERLHDVLEQASREHRAPQSEVSALRPERCIVFEDIGFRYPGASEDLLDSLSLEIPVGEVVAITGRSGEGKSTLIEIILGLIEADRGRLLVDSEVLDSGNMGRWQQAVGFVPQLVYMTDASVAENIAFGVPLQDIDLERVKYAARLAEIARHIENLPQGYDTQVGERGGLLSGGQRQRLGIARALYRDVSVLVLDEATSALDNDTQEDIFRNLKATAAGLTIIMVTHRQETLKHAGKVYSLTQGVLSEVDEMPDIEHAGR